MNIKKTAKTAAACCSVMILTAMPASVFASDTAYDTASQNCSGSGSYNVFNKCHRYNICGNHHNMNFSWNLPSVPPAYDDSDADTGSSDNDNSYDNSSSGSDISLPSEVTPPSDDTSDSSGNVSSQSGYTAEVISIVNQQRSANGLSALSYSEEAAKVAQAKAEDMAANNYFSHTSPTYGSAFDMLASNGVTYRSAGENIAKGQKTPSSVMDSWMNSSGHRANILSSSYTSIGVGYATDASGTPYWVQVFLG